MRHAVQHGLSAGALASLLLVGLFFVDYSPGSSFLTIARWFALDTNPWSKPLGAILLVVLGAVFGGIFAALIRPWSHSWLQTILLGLVMGLCWWIVLILLLSTLIRHIQQSPYGMLFWLLSSLLYGLVLGSLYARWQYVGGKR